MASNKTTISKILHEALVGKTLVSDGIHVFNLEIIDIDSSYGFEGEVEIIMKKEARTVIYPSCDIELRE